MLSLIRKQLINHLWHSYCNASEQARVIGDTLVKKNIQKFSLDHFAIIDLPGPETGIPQLSEIFLALGDIIRGRDYLPEKQNDFIWLAAKENFNLPAIDAHPQVVVADFRLEELPAEVRHIIEKYAQYAKPSPLKEIQELITLLAATDEAKKGSQITNDILTKLSHYFAGREWPLPTVKEYSIVEEFNELLAWTLIFGRRPNHFTLSIHLLDHFADLKEFLAFVSDETKFQLNTDGGMIKGGKNCGMEQASTKGTTNKIKLQDGDIDIKGDFIEFVWRYPREHENKAVFWDDYFTGFIAKHADLVIESLYKDGVKV